MLLLNVGTTTWSSGSGTPVLLLATDPADATLLASPLYGDRVATHDEESVAPGATGTFRFTVIAAAAGTYRIEVRPVVEGVTWLEDEGIYLELAVR